MAVVPPNALLLQYHDTPVALHDTPSWSGLLAWRFLALLSSRVSARHTKYIDAICTKDGVRVRVRDTVRFAFCSLGFS